MSESKHILFVGEYGWRNGGENSWLAIAPQLMKQGFRFSAAIPQHTELAESMKSLGISNVDFNLFDSTGVRKSQVEIRNDLSGIFSATAPDLIHCNSLSTGRLCGPVASDMRIPSLGYLRDIIKLSKQAIIDINCLDRIIAVSHATRDFHITQGMLPTKISVIYNGVNLEQFRPRSPSHQLHNLIGARITDRIITYIGQIGMRKGIEILLDCFLDLADSLDDVQLVIIGKRHSEKDEALEYETRLHQRSEQSHARRRIHWLGRRSDVPSILNDTTLLLHAARQEPLGRVLLESAACGIPFIATNVGGTAEIAGEWCNSGIVVPVDNAQAMTKQALSMLNAGHLHQQIADGLRSRAKKVFSAEKCAINLAGQYRELVSKAL